MRRTAYLSVAAAVAAAAVVFFFPDKTIGSVVVSAAAVEILLVLFVAGVLLWFLYWMCLRRFLRLRKLRRIRVAQGRRHPLA